MDQPGKTVQITGASAGLGTAFADLFARDGYHVVLTARREAQLEEIARTLERRHSARTTVIPADLSAPDAAAGIARRLEEAGIQIDALVNNAGVGTFGRFVESDPAAELAMIQVNVVALTHLTRLLLPGMVRRGAGRILNVASTAAFQPGPLMAVYYASKAYVLSFSEALGNELGGTGVTVTTLCPGPTTTEFHASASMDVARAQRLRLFMDAETVAKVGYRAMRKGKTVAIPGLGNWLLAQSIRFTPRRLATAVVRTLNGRLVE